MSNYKYMFMFFLFIQMYTFNLWLQGPGVFGWLWFGWIFAVDQIYAPDFVQTLLGWSRIKTLSEVADKNSKSSSKYHLLH